MQRLVFSIPDVSLPATPSRLSPAVDPRLLEEERIAATQKPPPPCPLEFSPPGAAMAAAQAAAPRAASPLPSPRDPTPPPPSDHPHGSSPSPGVSDPLQEDPAPTPSPATSFEANDAGCAAGPSSPQNPPPLTLSPVASFEGSDAAYTAGPSSPRNPPFPSLAPSSPLSTPPPSPGANDGQPCDVTLGIIGTQVGQGAKTVQWTDGPLTTLPYLGKKWGGTVRNVLSKDASYVSDMANFPVASPQSELVVFLDRRMFRHDLVNAARDALSRNKTVVIRGYMEDETFDFTMEALSDCFMASPDKPMNVHGA